MIIAFGREKNVGKDTFVMFIVEYLRQKHKNLHLVREGFADRLYDFCQSVYGWAGFESKQYYIMNPKAKDLPMPKHPKGWTPRKVLLNVAEKVREFDPEAFMCPVLFNKEGHVKFITDMRTPPEFEFGKNDPDTYLVRITAKYPGFKPISYGKEDIDHLLEPYDDHWDETIENNGNLNDFRMKAIEFSNRIILPNLQERLRSESLGKR